MEDAIEELAEELAKADGWISLKHPNPTTQDSIRARARTIIIEDNGK